jgi:protein-disulfide isomerase-like protein with CxxC motif
MRETDRAYVRGHWEQVRAASGQPFDFAFFERPSFVYDTEPACRAVAVARAHDGGLAVPFLAAVQRAFYAENRAVAQELAQTAELGVTGYPTLLALRSGRPQVVSMGWRPYPDVEMALLPLLGEATGD